MSGRASTALAALLLVQAAAAQDTTEFFRRNCVSCHTVGGGRLTGPDLKNVTERQDRAWLVRFMVNPRAMINSGDPYARQLYEESRNTVMPTISGLTEERARDLLDLIEEESALEESQFKGLQISDRPFTPEDRRLGLALFTGRQALANGGPACYGCHTIPGLDGLGGGRFGPDLTRAYERLGGRKNMGAWLYAPATPTMATSFQERPLEDYEILALLSVFEQAAVQGEPDETADRLSLLLIGFGGAVLALVAFDWIWRRRALRVRAPLVEGESIPR